MPCISRRKSIQPVVGMYGMAKVAAQNQASPSSQTRRGPYRSVRLPDTMMTLPYARM
ncbi:hypothetical protein D3C78_1926690 [compost metagenome]